MIKRITRVLYALKNTSWVARLIFLVYLAALTGGLAVQAQPAKFAGPAITPAVAISAANQNSPAGQTAQEPVAVTVQTETAAPPAKLTTPPTAPVQPCVPQGSPIIKAASLSGLPTGYHESQPEITYYQVYGNTPSSIYDQIMACGPLFSGGTRYAAATSYQFNWGFQATPTEAGNCRLDSVKVVVRSDILMPSWQKSANATAKAASYWSSSSKNLLNHELGHANITYKAAQSLYQQLLSLPSAESCDVIRAQANSLGNKARADTYQAQLAYDRATNHGTN